MKTVAVLQPTYLPWIGYFAMIKSCDLFIFLDDVQYEHRSWQNRNRIKMSNGQSTWLTVPVHINFGQKINEVKINNNKDWRKKHWETIRQSYSKAKHFAYIFEVLLTIYEVKWTELAELNIGTIQLLCDILEIKTEVVRSSELEKTDGAKADRLLAILKQVECTEYIANPGSRNYLEPKVPEFNKENIVVKWFEYQHPTYTQLHGKFIPYMSVIDLLLNEGENAKNVIC